MNVRELNREQLLELKERYLIDWYASNDRTPSWGEMADAGAIVDDDTIFDYFDGIDFVEEDFACSSN